MNAYLSENEDSSLLAKFQDLQFPRLACWDGTWTKQLPTSDAYYSYE
jgi:hypothetical protein